MSDWRYDVGTEAACELTQVCDGRGHHETIRGSSVTALNEIALLYRNERLQCIERFEHEVDRFAHGWQRALFEGAVGYGINNFSGLAQLFLGCLDCRCHERTGFPFETSLAEMGTCAFDGGIRLGAISVELFPRRLVAWLNRHHQIGRAALR